MVEKIFNYVMLTESPTWLDKERLLTYLPSEEPISLASLRSWVVLAPSDLAQILCPPRKECYPIEASEAARRALASVLERINEARRLSEVKEVIKGLDRFIDNYVKDVDTIECVDTFNLGCYIPAHQRNPDREPTELRALNGPLVVVNVEGIDINVAEVVTRLGVSDSEYATKYLSRSLFESVLKHEVFHAFTDLSNDLSPRKTLEKHSSSRFYYRIIEESLATYYELWSLDHDIHTRYLKIKLLSKSPLEYRAGILWMHRPRNTVDSILKAWIGTLSPIILVCDYLGALFRMIDYLELPRFRWDLPLALRRAISDVIYEVLATGQDTVLWKILALKLASLTPSNNLMIYW